MRKILSLIESCNNKVYPRFPELNRNLRIILSKPNNEIKVNFPVKIKNNTCMFTGYRVQHNNLLGPYKGGLRFNPLVEPNEINALSQ